MLIGIKVKLYPNNEQLHQLEQNIGNVRFVWNQLLGMWNTRYVNNPNLVTLTKYDLHLLLPALKTEYPFLKDGESSSLQVVGETLHGSFIEFFKGSRKHPRFKSKKVTKPSFTMKNNKNIALERHAIKLPKIGWVKARWSNNLSFEKIKRVTITRTFSGYYIASVLVESESQVLDKTGKLIGIDMGQIDLMIGSDGLRVKTRMYKAYEKQLAKWQRKQARRLRLAKANGVPLLDAKNYQKAKQMVAKYHEKIRHCRKDYLHKESTKIVKACDFIAVENLKSSNMMANPKNKKNLKANHHKIANQSWHELRVMFAYKCDKSGKTFVKVNPRYTSQDCSQCHQRTGPKGDTKIREWTCLNCLAHHDRDINAGKNILAKGLALVS